MSIVGFDIFGRNNAVNFNVEEKPKKFDAVVNIFKKPFMPTSWKWFRTSGSVKVYTYVARKGESTTLSFKIPSQFKKYIRASDGAVFEGNSITMEGDTGDYFTTGKRVTVSMFDADSQGKLRRPVTFPQMAFRTNGVDYHIDWNHFANMRKVALGASDEDWGYAKKGQPTYGIASMYDSEIGLTWNREIKWWMLLLGAGALVGLWKILKKR